MAPYSAIDTISSMNFSHKQVFFTRVHAAPVPLYAPWFPSVATLPPANYDFELDHCWWMEPASSHLKQIKLLWTDAHIEMQMSTRKMSISISIRMTVYLLS